MGADVLESRFSPRFQQLCWYEYVVIAVVAVALVGYLPMVVRRVVVHGFGDVQVFFRAGWAIWSGYPLYDVVDSHSWSYHYPPTFAFLMGLFADPMPGFPKPAWSLSYPVSIALWYVISAIAMLAALHVWARGLERFAVGPFDQRQWNGWWALRLGPMLALLPFIGDGFGRGQPTSILLLSMVGFLVLYVRGHTHAAALMLAIGATIKIFPAALLIIPLLRRDLKVIFATGIYGLLLLVAVPVLCVGPAATVDLYHAMWNDHLRGIVSGAPNAKIAAEITFTSYDMLSVGAMLTRIAAGGLPASAMLPGWAGAAQFALNSVILFALVGLGYGRFWRWGGAQPPPLSYDVLLAGAVICAALPVMLSTSQPNYVAFAAPLVAVFQLKSWRDDGKVRVPVSLLAWSCVLWVGMIVIEVEFWRPLRVVGLMTPLLLGLVGWGLFCLSRRSQEDDVGVNAEGN